MRFQDWEDIGRQRVTRMILEVGREVYSDVYRTGHTVGVEGGVLVRLGATQWRVCVLEDG